MKEAGQSRSAAVVERDGLQYVPLSAAITTLGGTASFDGDREWTVEYNGIQSTVHENGKTKVNGDRVATISVLLQMETAEDFMYLRRCSLR